MNLTPEQRAAGKENFYTAAGFTRREFLAASIAAGGAASAGIGAMYFGYDKASMKNPVRVGWIGTGDEGGVLIGAHTPDYLQITAICDIRPLNVYRAFHGDCASPHLHEARPGLMAKYGWETEDEARKHVKVYQNYNELLDDKDIEAVVIALPLFLHAPVAIAAMKKGKHVLTEKLMGHSIAECKEMGRVSEQTQTVLAVGHQRHYSVLYDNAVQAILKGVLGDIHHIRAQWHRNNLPGHDSWQPSLPDDPSLAKAMEKIKGEYEAAKAAGSKDADQLASKWRQWEAQIADKDVDALKYGYQDKTLDTGHKRSALEELIRWRLWDRTSAGLMAELGSHQLDASGIFVSAMHQRAAGPGAKKMHIHPLTVTAVGGRSLFPNDRDCDDHVYCTFEYPAPGYDKDPNKKIVVTYSSINGSDFGGYGEYVMGTQRTLFIEKELEALLFQNAGKEGLATKIGVSKDKDGTAILDTTESGGSTAAAVGKAALEPVSKGYTEELEHWAWCIRNPSSENKPRCGPRVALGDAVIALTTNLAMHKPENRNRIEFKPEWFDLDKDDTPEGDKPDLTKYKT